jgi:hypothetical protein
MANARRNGPVVVAVVLAALVLVVATVFVVRQNDLQPSIPALSTLFNQPPAPGYTLEANGPVNGYMTPDQIKQFVDLPTIPSGIDVYGMGWARTDGTVIVEFAISLSRVNQAESVLAGMAHTFSSHGRSEPAPLAGRTIAFMIPAAPGHDIPEMVVGVVRSRLVLVYVEAGTDVKSGGATTLANLARTTAADVPVDTGSPESVPVVRSAAFQVGEVLGLSVIPVLVIALVTVLVQMSRSKRLNY